MWTYRRITGEKERSKRLKDKDKGKRKNEVIGELLKRSEMEGGLKTYIKETCTLISWEHRQR